MINTCVIVGRLPRDPDLRYTRSGLAVTSFQLAVERPFKNKEGVREVDWINITCWKKVAESLCENCKKGEKIGVVGRLQNKEYTDNEGTKHKTFEIMADNVQFLGSSGASGDTSIEGYDNKDGLPF